MSGPTAALMMACALALGASDQEARNVWERVRGRYTLTDGREVLAMVREALGDERADVASVPYVRPEPRAEAALVVSREGCGMSDLDRLARAEARAAAAESETARLAGLLGEIGRIARASEGAA